MYKPNATFVERCLSGEALLDDLDHAVEQWHMSDASCSLAEFLGLTDDEYSILVENPDALRAIIFARKSGVPLVDALEWSECSAMAARAKSPSEAKQVIDQAIRENRVGEWLLYALAVLFVVVGLSALVCGIIQGEPLIAGAGTVSSILFWPAMSSARRTRKESIAIRLLEAPLSRADTAKEASEMLQRLFDEIFRDKKRDG